MSTTHRRRKCSARGCITILSRFNAGPRCWLHTTSPEPATERESRGDLIDLLDVVIGGWRP